MKKSILIILLISLVGLIGCAGMVAGGISYIATGNLTKKDYQLGTAQYLDLILSEKELEKIKIKVIKANKLNSRYQWQAEYQSTQYICDNLIEKCKKIGDNE